MRDPNPKVAGSGFTRLQACGITVDFGLLEAQARELNIGFFSRMEHGSPWLRLKIAASMDGVTALQNGISQWITSESTRHDVQHWRARSCAILTGIGTVLADNPALNVREFDIGRQPLRVVVDSRLRLTSTSKILQGSGVLVACCDDSTPNGARLCDAGAEILAVPGDNGKVDLSALLKELAQREINDVLVEAGSILNGALLQANLVNELLLYFAPTLLGANARGMFDFPALYAMSQRIELDIFSLDRIGIDLRLRARPK